MEVPAQSGRSMSTCLTVECLSMNNFVVNNRQQVDKNTAQEETVTVRTKNGPMNLKHQRPVSLLTQHELYNLPISKNDNLLTSAYVQTGSVESIKLLAFQSPTSDVETLSPVTETPVNKKRLKQKMRSTGLQQLFRHRRKSTEQAPSSVTLQNDQGGLLFGLPLDVICQPEGTLPRPVLILLACIWHFGPATEGVFRCSPNARAAREMKQLLESSMTSSSFTVHVQIHVATHLLKDLLRSLPNCLLGCELYSSWIQTLEFKQEESAAHMKHLIGQLSTNHQVLLCHVVRLLQRISLHNKVNQMTSSNLGVCIGPSLLWAPTVDQPPASSNSGTLRRTGGKLLGNTKSQRSSAVVIDNCCDFKDANFPPLVVQRLIDAADILFNNFNWSPAAYDVINSSGVLTSQLSKSVSSLDDSDIICDDYEWAVSIESQQSNVSDGSELSQSLPIPLINITHVAPAMSPIPPPRTKKLRRQAAGVFMTSQSDLTTSTQQPDLVLPVLPDKYDEDASIRRYELIGRLVSNDSLLESLDERAAEYEDDTRSCSDLEPSAAGIAKTLLHESTQSLTSSDGTGALTLRGSQATQRTDSFLRRSSVPVGETDQHFLITRTSRLNRRQFQQLSTDSAISADIDVDHTTSVFPEHDYLITSKRELTNVPVVQLEPISMTSPMNIYAGIKPGATRQEESCEPSVNIDQLTISNATTFNNGNRRRGMTSSGADLFPLCMRTCTVAVAYPYDVDEKSHDSHLVVSSAQQGADMLASRTRIVYDTHQKAQQLHQNDVERKRKKLLRLRDRFALDGRQRSRCHGKANSSSSNSSSSEGETFNADTPSSGDDDDATKRNELFRRRRAASQRRSYNSWRGRKEKKPKNIERAQSDSVRLINRQHQINSEQRHAIHAPFNDRDDQFQHSTQSDHKLPAENQVTASLKKVRDDNIATIGSSAHKEPSNVEQRNTISTEEESVDITDSWLSTCPAKHGLTETDAVPRVTRREESQYKKSSLVPTVQESSSDEQRVSKSEPTDSKKAVELVGLLPIRQQSFNYPSSTSVRDNNRLSVSMSPNITTVLDNTVVISGQACPSSSSVRDNERLSVSMSPNITTVLDNTMVIAGQASPLKVKERSWHQELVAEYSSMKSSNSTIARRHSDCSRADKTLSRYQSQCIKKSTPIKTTVVRTPSSVDDVINTCWSLTNDIDVTDAVIFTRQCNVTKPFELRHTEPKLDLPTSRDDVRNLEATPGVNKQKIYTWSVASLRNAFET